MKKEIEYFNFVKQQLKTDIINLEYEDKEWGLEQDEIEYLNKLKRFQAELDAGKYNLELMKHYKTHLYFYIRNKKQQAGELK